MSLSDWTLLAPLAYQGKKDCTNPTCTRDYLDGQLSADCRSWHCSYCDAPCSMMGHKCDAARAVLGEAERIAEERAM